MPSGKHCVELDVGIAPDLLTEAHFEGALCAVIDVLRATTTIVVALANGAVEVRPCLNAAEARGNAALLSNRPYLLGGEEKGHRIPGFHLGNSPLEYAASDTVAGKTIFFSTTNGTPIMRKAHAFSGSPLYIAAFINVSAVSSALVRTMIGSSIEKVLLLCSGLLGKPSAEDFLCAGLVTQKVRHELLQADIDFRLSDSALIATGFATGNKGKTQEVLTASEHGRYLQRIGFANDIEFACQIDTYDVVPIFDGERVVPQRDIR